jgi:hypothetical protein
MTQTIGNSTKTTMFDIFKIILNSNKLQICPNQFLVEGNIALYYLGQLPYFTK